MHAAADPASKQPHHSSTRGTSLTTHQVQEIKQTQTVTIPLLASPLLLEAQTDVKDLNATPATALTFTFTVKLKLFNTFSAWLIFHLRTPSKASGLLLHHLCLSFVAVKV